MSFNLTDMSLESLKFAPLTNENIKEVYQMCEENVLFLSHPIDAFKKVSLGSNLFDPDLSVVTTNDEGTVIAFFMMVLRRSNVPSRKVAALKFFVVKKEWRLKGLGSMIYSRLVNTIKISKNPSSRMKIEAMRGQPDYWLPGLDPRHTEAFFFLKKQGFNKGREFIDLCVDLSSVSETQPPSEFNGYKIRRATINDEDELIPLKFMPKLYQFSFWPEEVKLSLQNDPISTFIASEPKREKIAGWASHSVQYPGSFGPTGVKKSERGRGLGSLLLKWCLWDLKNIGLKQCQILWVEEDTVYFYLKSIGARICKTYWLMNKKL